jgi:excinuclease ABC subunit C
VSAARAVVARLPADPGVYRFRDETGRVLYVGRAVNLRRRAGSYWGDLRDRPRLRRMVARIAGVEAVVCDSEHEAAWLERNVLERAKPRWNRMLGGLEVPVCIRLDQHGLAVVHQTPAGTGVRYFGPYLGGEKVRTAVSGLGRLLPLAYASDRLRGSEREMARVRGVEPADRDRFVQTVIAALERDVAAVSALRLDLVGRRDAAAAVLAFELAAKVQAEIEALDWVVAAQRVSHLDLVDFDVYGWHAGVLVKFEVRDGRLSGWRQRACSEASARPKLAATPPGWAAFAQRNAALAAHLRSDPTGQYQSYCPVPGDGSRATQQ